LESDYQWLNSAGTGQNGISQPVSGVPPPEITVPQPKVVASPPGDALMVHTVFFGQLIFGKIITFVATRGQILRLKFTKLYFGWGSAPDPAGGACSAPPYHLAGFKGPTSKGRERREGKGKGGERREREGRKCTVHHLFLSNLTTADW